MTGPTRHGAWFALVESNTTGTGRDFCGAARRRGLRPVLLTRDAGRYPYAAADGVQTRTVDTGDLAAVLDACRVLVADGGLAGITSSSEYFVSVAARVAAQLGLPGSDADAIDRCRAKDSQRAVLRAGGVPVPAFAVVETVADAVLAAGDIGCPVVLKPVMGSGSVGVRMCHDAGETALWATELLSRATDERGNAEPARILVEAAVTGPEFSVETFDNAVIAVVTKHLTPPPHFVEVGHDVPTLVPQATALGTTALRALTALGLGWGAAHTELRCSAEGPVVIEVNPRLAGGMIPTAVQAAIGVDLVDHVIARAAGQPPPPRGPAQGHAAIRFRRAEQAGTVTVVGGVDSAATAPGVIAAATSTTVGRDVHITHSFQDRLACVVAAGNDHDQAADRATTALDMIDIRVESTSRRAPTPDD